MAILVTGGAGYIGTHTCVELLEAGYDIVVIDNFSNSKPESLQRVSKMTRKHIKTYPVDLVNERDLETVFAENDIEAVIHFAGLKAVGESTVVPLKYYQNNLTGTVNLCRIMQAYDVKKLVFSSSATVYGTIDNKPIDETTVLGAVNPYGRSKLMIEEMLRDLAHSDPDWKIAILRYFNPIGAHESGLIGEDPTGIPNNLLPYIAQVAIGKLEYVNVYGNDYPTKDGTGVRDYIHVVDLAFGHLKALEKIETIRGIDAFNLGTGRGYTVLEVIKAFENVIGTSIPYKFTDRRPGDVGICYANPQKAQKQLNWFAQKGIKTMCEDTWRWQREHPYGYDGMVTAALKYERMTPQD